MAKILVVDDEKSFVQSLKEGLETALPEVKVFTAWEGSKALSILKKHGMDLLITDLRMDGMDGLTLMDRVQKDNPLLPIIAISAYGNHDLKNQCIQKGAVYFLDKPLDFRFLVTIIRRILALRERTHIVDVDVVHLLQIQKAENKSSKNVLYEKSGKMGTIYLQNGIPIHAESKGKSGDEIFKEMLTWEVKGMDIHPLVESIPCTITIGLEEAILESAVALDHQKRKKPKKEEDMSVKEILTSLQEVEGFQGVGVFTPTGEKLAAFGNGLENLEAIGVLANNVLMNAQKATLEMGVGRGNLIHIQAEKAHLLVSCLNEGKNPLKSEPGKAHIHVVLALSNDNAIGFAKMKLRNVVTALAEHFRV